MEEKSFEASVTYNQSRRTGTSFKANGNIIIVFEGKTNAFLKSLKRKLKSALIDPKAKMHIFLSFSYSDSSLGKFDDKNIIEKAKTICREQLNISNTSFSIALS